MRYFGRVPNIPPVSHAHTGTEHLGKRRFINAFAITIVVLGMTLTSLSGAVIGAQDEDRPTITVGSLSFTESVILGEMFSLMLEDAGYNVERQFNVGISADLHEAIVSGDIDLYVEYTGGGLVSILGLPVPTVGTDGTATPGASIQEQTYTTVTEAYAEEFGLVWLDEIGFNNTYVMAVTAETAETLDLATVSELADHAGDMTLGTDEEFSVRQDGLPGLEAAYGIEFGVVEPGDPGLMYTAIENGDVDVITAYATDGRLPGLELVMLEDDMSFFPPYFAAPVVSGELLEQNPELEEVLNRLAGTIDDGAMADLNFQVDDGGMEEIDVARAYLEEQGLIGGEE